MTQLLLRLNDVGISFDGKPILTNVSLDVAENDFILFRGPNGGGKTTLLRLMAGLLAPTHGFILRAPGLTLGYLPQYRSIDRKFPITADEVVLSGLAGRKSLWKGYSQTDRSRALSVMQRLSIDHLCGLSIDRLSGGEWQRVLLARALASEPHILLLDEPDTHLDAENKQVLYATLRNEATQRAIVIVSHDASLPSMFPNARIMQVERCRATMEQERPKTLTSM